MQLDLDCNYFAFLWDKAGFEVGTNVPDTCLLWNWAFLPHKEFKVHWSVLSHVVKSSQYYKSAHHDLKEDPKRQIIIDFNYNFQFWVTFSSHYSPRVVDVKSSLTTGQVGNSAFVNISVCFQSVWGLKSHDKVMLMMMIHWEVWECFVVFVKAAGRP